MNFKEQLELLQKAVDKKAKKDKKENKKAKKEKKVEAELPVEDLYELTK